MKLSDVRKLNNEELMNLKVGDRVWYCPLLFKSSMWDGDLEQGVINHIFRRSEGRRQVVALDLNDSSSDIQGFRIGCLQVPCEHVYKPK